MVNQHKPEILVVGTGAVGGFYGGKLAQSGAKVSTVCRSDFSVVSSKGITIKSCWSDFQFFPNKVLRSPEEFEGYPDYILVATKVLPSIKLSVMIESVVGPKTTIVLLQNGIDIEPPIAKSFPKNELISGLAFVCVCRTAPGVIQHLDYGRLTLGCFPKGRSTKIDLLHQLFLSSGIPCEISTDIIIERWKKLVWNVPFNSISVLGGGLNTREIIASSRSINFVKKIMQEVCRTAQSSKHTIPTQIIDQHLKHTKIMKPYKTSMLLDYQAGNPMEIEAILGNTMRIALRNGVETPFLSCLYNLLKLLADQERVR